MTLDEMVGMQLAVGLPGPALSKELADRLRLTHAGHVILFERNLASAAQAGALIAQARVALGRILVLIDHEGGRIIRFRDGVTRFPDALTVGRTQTPADVERQGSIEARELSRLGIQVNLAPCVDVFIEQADSVIGDRSYGSDPDRVAALAVARIRGLQSHRVAACAKHFPGLGAVPRDPHKVLPTIRLSWNEMRRTHLPPFQAAMEAGVASVMSSHVCYPSLGDADGVPATFSPRLIRELLRTTMRFDGVVMTDDLEMGALRAWGSMGEIAVRSVEAGHDLLLICSDLSAAAEAHAALRDAYEQGRLPRQALERSVARLKHLRDKYL